MAGSGFGGAGGSGGVAGADAGSGGAGTVSARLDGMCSQSGLRACDVTDDKQTLLCSQGVWESNGGCDESEACNPQSGLCAEIVDGCVGLTDGARYCAPDGDVWTCGPNLVSGAFEEACLGPCVTANSTAECTPPDCGDGEEQSDEECDDGNDDNTDECTVLCRPPECGDGFEQAGEDCDAGIETATCDPDCSDVVCGDGYHNGSAEGCDDGNTDPGDGCSATCSREIRLAAGHHYNCALRAAGQVKCWGDNSNGQLGLGDTEARGDEPDEMGSNLPEVDLGSGRTGRELALGHHHTCALLDDGSIKCWGDNDNGQLGLGDVDARGDEPGEMGDDLPAVDLGSGRTARAVVAVAYSTCALLDDGAVKCWGYNASGTLGLGDSEPRGDDPGDMGDALPAVDLGTGRSVRSLTAGFTHVCALLDDDSIKCWGYNTDGQLGLGDAAHRGDAEAELGDDLPTVQLGSGRSARAVYAGGYYTCALLDDGSLKCWGQNDYGQLGLGDTPMRHGDGPGEMGDALPAIDLGSGSSVRAVTPGYYFVCARFDDLSVKCWGQNNYGQLGLGDNANRGDTQGEMGDMLPAVDLGDERAAHGLALGGYHTCALLDDESIRCWGQNQLGQLGLGDTMRRGDSAGELGDALPVVELW